MSSSPSSSRPHVLLVLTDQQSLWTISAYHRLLRDGGYASAADFGLGRAPAWAPLPTPHIDALAAGGAIFANFVATSPMCVPSRASLFTGLYAVNHRATADGGLPDGTPTLGAAMAAAGYAGIDTTGDGKADTVLGQMAVDTTGDGHADTVLETPFEVTLDSWLGLYFVPSFMEMLKKAKKSGGLSFN